MSSMEVMGAEGCAVGSHTSSTRVTETRVDAGTTVAVITPVPSFWSVHGRLEGTDAAGAVPCLWFEWGRLLTHERPTRDVSFLHPSLAVGGVEG